MVIRQGDVFWLDLGEPRGAEPAYRHPHVVVQNNVFNASQITTIVLCALTSNLSRGLAPGNVTLNEGEANLPKASVVNVTQIVTVDRSALTAKIGTLSKRRVRQIVAGIGLLVNPRELE